MRDSGALSGGSETATPITSVGSAIKGAQTGSNLSYDVTRDPRRQKL